ncbi:MAG TPA: hypothetical protein VEI97_03905, partial [bacterium]|nr:hypothetical protein [bacterium]
MPASFRNEWPTWVLAFVIALGLWTWINLSARPDVQSRTVPLVLEESDVLEVAPASQLPGQVEVRVEGNEDDVREYMESLKRA